MTHQEAPSSTPISAVGMVNGFGPGDLARQPRAVREKVERRRSLLGPGYQLFYADPIEVTHGRDVYLYGPNGTEYLDAYNNVASVGHAHPEVVSAVSDQLGSVNTNTRYLQDGILDYSEELLETFPPELNRVTYTCTGSEANDLAVRIARYHTRGTGLVVTCNAYHGVTSSAAEFSPSLGAGSPLGPHVRLVGPPDPRLAGRVDSLGDSLRTEVRRAIADLERHGIKFSAFIADSIFSSDGVFTHPAPVLRAVADEVHAAGGLFIADEVQAGFGRTGEQWWGFERHELVPDLVTLGKPMGNGYPVAAVVLKHSVGDEFGREVRYFNTFGGSTAAIAAARAVIHVVKKQNLIENARVVGAYLRDRLEHALTDVEAVSEVRGVGMFLGVEVVDADDVTRADGALAREVVNAVRHQGILISASGPAGNVLKIRPPLTFQRSHADRLVDALERAFSVSTAVRPISSSQE